MKTISISLRVDPGLVERIKAVTDNRNQFFIEAAEEKLNPVKCAELTDREKKDVLKGAKTLNDYLKDAILQEASKRKNFLDGMSNEDFARLVSARLPKEENVDSGLEQDVLSLRECLEKLPSMEDVTRELNRVKGLLFKAEMERDLNLKLLKRSQNKVELGELMDAVYRGAVEYALELVTRNSLPGFGDGGGLTDKGYADVARRVKKELEQMELYRK